MSRTRRRALNELIDNQRDFLWPGRWSRVRHPRWILRRRLRAALENGHIVFSRPDLDGPR